MVYITFLSIYSIKSFLAFYSDLSLFPLNPKKPIDSQLATDIHTEGWKNRMGTIIQHQVVHFSSGEMKYLSFSSPFLPLPIKCPNHSSNTQPWLSAQIPNPDFLNYPYKLMFFLLHSLILVQNPLPSSFFPIPFAFHHLVWKSLFITIN